MKTINERVSNVTYQYNEDTNSAGYLVSLPALHHAKCGHAPDNNTMGDNESDCRVDHCAWDTGWNIMGNGILNAAGVPGLVPVRCCQNSRPCDYPCGSTRQYTYLINGRPVNYHQPNLYGFITIMLESDIGGRIDGYREDELRNINPREKIIWYLKLLGEYSNKPDETIAFPWLNTNKAKYVNRLAIIERRDYIEEIILRLSRGSKSDRTIEILSNPRHERWNKLKRMYEQLLWVVLDRGWHFNTLEQEIFASAHSEFRMLTHREPNEHCFQ